MGEILEQLQTCVAGTLKIRASRAVVRPTTQGGTGPVILLQQPELTETVCLLPAFFRAAHVSHIDFHLRAHFWGDYIMPGSRKPARKGPSPARLFLSSCWGPQRGGWDAGFLPLLAHLLVLRPESQSRNRTIEAWETGPVGRRGRLGTLSSPLLGLSLVSDAQVPQLGQ